MGLSSGIRILRTPLESERSVSVVNFRWEVLIHLLVESDLGMWWYGGVEFLTAGLWSCDVFFS